MLRTSTPSVILFAILICGITLAHAAPTIVPHGQGAYQLGLPPGAQSPPPPFRGSLPADQPLPTNDWWSSLLWSPLGHPLYPHPLTVWIKPQGLAVHHPATSLHANHDAIFAPFAETTDLLISHDKISKIESCQVTSWSDSTVSFTLGPPQHHFHHTIGHGLPWIFSRLSSAHPTFTFREPPTILHQSPHATALRIGRNTYAIFLPSTSSWISQTPQTWTANLGTKDYFSVAVLPDESEKTFLQFSACAHRHVTGVEVSWKYDESRNSSETRFSITTENLEGTAGPTLIALYPHHWRNSLTPLTGQSYPSVRGPLKLTQQTSFTVTHPLPPLLPGLPLLPDQPVEPLRQLLRQDLNTNPPQSKDTYWIGKELGRLAALLPLAEQVDDTAAANECRQRLQAILEDFLTAKPNATSATPGFAYDPRWGALTGFPASYGSDDQLNDHHFHYGYFLRAAAELARRDPAWAKKWEPMLRLLVREIACPDRKDPMFPFLRCFDPYAGHSWASGHAKFTDGNNNESSSEAANAWAGIAFLGEALGDKNLRDLGLWLFSVETSAIHEYWFNSHRDLFPADYPIPVVTMVWGNKGANGTWFSANPEAIHGINFLPITGSSFYLGTNSEYTALNDRHLVQANLNFEKTKNPEFSDGNHFDQWADLIWMYRCFHQPVDARNRWNQRPAHFKPEQGNSLSQTEAWIRLFESSGKVDGSSSANHPFTLTLRSHHGTTHIAWNSSPKALTIHFKDGTSLTVPPTSFAFSLPKP